MKEVQVLKNDTQKISCPHCGSDNFVKNGKYKDKQRYLCKSCQSTFNLNTNTAIHHIRDIDNWHKFIKIMLSSDTPLSLNKLAKEIKISSKTVHNWKHKFLSSLIEVDTLDYRGTLEVNIVYIPFWTKGKHDVRKTDQVRDSEVKHKEENKYASFLCVIAENDDFDFFPVQIGKEKIVDKDHLYKCLEQLNLPKSSRIRTKLKKDIWSYYYENGYDCQIIEEHPTRTDILMNGFKNWTKNFKGFSTKYIWNYLKWYKIRSLYRKGHNINELIQLSLKDSRGWLRFMMINHFYREFIISK